MSYSYEYCINAVQNPKRSKWTERDWSKAKEFGDDASLLFDLVLKGLREYELTSEDGSKSIKMRILFDPDADFDYYTSASSVHDGTIMSIHANVMDCVLKVVQLQTRNAYMPPPDFGDEVTFTVGNFVILNEYDGDFVSKDKPWMRERTTVLLPLKMEIKHSS